MSHRYSSLRLIAGLGLLLAAHTAGAVSVDFATSGPAGDVCAETPASCVDVGSYRGVFTDGVTGLRVYGLYKDSDGSWKSARLWRRNDTNDNGFGICSPGEEVATVRGVTGCTRTGGGDINELSDAVNPELVALELPDGYQWSSVGWSSLDTNASGQPPERGRIYASDELPTDEPVDSLNADSLKDLTGGIDPLESARYDGGFPIPLAYQSTRYLLFQPYDFVDNGASDNNDYLVLFANLESQELGQIGDRVWYDRDADGLQDCADTGNDGILGNAGDTGSECADEGVNGVLVELLTCEGVLKDTQSTSSLDDGSPGFYRFTGLLRGCYQVRFERPEGYECSPALVGSNRAIDSDPEAAPGVDGSCGISEPINLVAGQIDLSHDAGLYEKTSLGDFVWNDLDRDGVQDDGEEGIWNVKVALYTCADASSDPEPTGSMKPTDVNGFYLFDDLTPGYYAVGFMLPDGYVFSPSKIGDDQLDSDAEFIIGDEGKSACRLVESNEPDLDIDAGMYFPVAALGDRCFEDLNANGIQDDGEPGVEGCAVTLRDPGPDGQCDTTDDVLIDDVTGGNGLYLFDGLVPKGYCGLTFTPPSNYCGDLGDAAFTTQNAPGSNAGNDSDVDADGSTGLIDLAPDQTDLSWDAGIYCPARLGDRVWEDRIENDLQDCEDTNGDGKIGGPSDTGPECDAGVGDVPVRLLSYATADCSDNGSLVEVQDTDSDGFYLFDIARPGAYRVEFGLPDGYARSKVGVGDDDLIDSDADLTTGLTPCIGVKSLTTDRSWDSGIIKTALCDVSATKTCVVLPPPPSENFNCSDAKPIDSLSMVSQFDGPVAVRGWFGNVGTMVVDEALVYPDETVTLSGFAGAPNDVYWEIFDGSFNGPKLGESVFHRSCSDSEMNGPEDCGKPEGDGKSDSSALLNKWSFEGMAGNGQVLSCSPPDVVATGSECEFFGHSGDACDGKVLSTSLAYVGGACTITNPQSGKATCSGVAPGGTSLVRIRISDGGSKIYYDSGNDASVGVGDVVTASAANAGENDFGSNTVFEIFDSGSNLVQSGEFHTSCSQPLNLGDQFGALKVVSVNSTDGGLLTLGAQVQYQYSVTNNSTDDLNFSGIDDKLEGKIFDDVTLQPGQTKTATRDAFVLPVGGDSVTNTLTVSGKLVSAADLSCDATASAVVYRTVAPETCAECDGGTTRLSVKYRGSTTVDVHIVDDKDFKTDRILFAGSMAPDDVVVLEPRIGKSKLEKEISFWIDGVRVEKLKTDCSKPIGAGLVIAGVFELVEENRSEKNGLMCPLSATYSASAADSLVIKDNKVEWSLSNTGVDDLFVERITISWPTGVNAGLKKVKLDGDDIYTTVRDVSPATIATGWHDDIKRRLVEPGDTVELKFEFEEDASPVQTDYAITVEFMGDGDRVLKFND